MLAVFVIHNRARYCLHVPPQHPLLALYWQMFFILYFARFELQALPTPPAPGNDGGFYGFRFFEGRTGQQLLADLRKRLALVHDHLAAARLAAINGPSQAAAAAAGVSAGGAGPSGAAAAASATGPVPSASASGGVSPPATPVTVSHAIHALPPGAALHDSVYELPVLFRAMSLWLQERSISPSAWIQSCLPKFGYKQPVTPNQPGICFCALSMGTSIADCPWSSASASIDWKYCLRHDLSPELAPARLHSLLTDQWVVTPARAASAAPFPTAALDTVPGLWWDLIDMRPLLVGSLIHIQDYISHPHQRAAIRLAHRLHEPIDALYEETVCPCSLCVGVSTYH